MIQLIKLQLKTLATIKHKLIKLLEVFKLQGSSECHGDVAKLLDDAIWVIGVDRFPHFGKMGSEQFVATFKMLFDQALQLFPLFCITFNACSLISVMWRCYSASKGILKNRKES